ncbi:MAG: hypothetical protein K2K38_03125 [Clostridia bacterium]|nr:hypothetical protein [Clostridia bacterium]
MRSEEMLDDVKKRLDSMTIYEVRQIAREVKAHVTSGQKGAIIDAILLIAQGEVDFAPQSKRGAPPKSDKYDEQLVADIFACREYFLAVKQGGVQNSTMTVNDSGYDFSEKEYSGYLNKEGQNYFLHAEEIVFVSDLFVTRYSLRIGDFIRCKGRRKNKADLVGAYEILSVNGSSPEESKKRNNFSTLTHLYPVKRVYLSDGGDISLRMIDLFSPVALGQRGVISAPANSGKTTLIKSIALGVCAKYRDFEVIILTLGARPEEVTEFNKLSGKITYFYTSFDKSDEEHLSLANLAFEYAKRRVELQKNAIILVDGLYENLPAEAVKNCLFCAINAEEGGSLTVVAAMPQEFNYSGVANMVINLSPVLVAERLFPAIDILKSYSGREEGLLNEEERKLSVALRSKLSHGAEAEEIIDLFKKTKSNAELAEIIKNG